ncbi:MAG: hypothetical protein ACPG8O_10025, partial [Alcanivorax nanhaiticus]
AVKRRLPLFREGGVNKKTEMGDIAVHHTMTPCVLASDRHFRSCTAFNPLFTPADRLRRYR